MVYPWFFPSRYVLCCFTRGSALVRSSSEGQREEGIQTLVRRKKVLCALHASLSTLCSLLTLLLLFPIFHVRSSERHRVPKLLLFFLDIPCKPSKICRLLSAPIYITLKAPSDLVQDLEESYESRKKAEDAGADVRRDALRLKACCRCDFNMLYADAGRRSRREWHV